MATVAYTSKIHLERRKGPLRIAHLPGETQPVIFSVHGAIAEHYKIDPASLTDGTPEFTLTGANGQNVVVNPVPTQPGANKANAANAINLAIYFLVYER